MTSKIWRITQPIDDEILSDAMVYNYYDLLECSLCRCKLATPAASLELGLAWHSKVTNPRVIATMGYGFGIVIQKKYADILAEKFSGFNVLPIKEEEDSPDNETPPLSGFPDYLIRYPYTGPEFVGIIPTVSAWSDLDLSKWSYHSLCPECGHLGIKIVGKPVPGRCNIWYNVPKSQLKGTDFFCMKDVVSYWPFFCTTAFKEALEAFNDGSFCFEEEGVIYDDSESPFEPPFVKPWEKYVYTPKNTATSPAKPRKKKVKFSDLDESALESPDDLLAYNIVLDTPDDASEAACPVTPEERLDYVKMEMSIEKVKRMTFKRAAQLGDSVYWIWKYFDEDNAPCYFAVEKGADGSLLFMTDDTDGLSPEQYLVAAHFRLY